MDNSGIHGLIMSLDEASLNWYESDKWCKSLGNGWFMPTVKDFESMKDNDNLNKIQNALIREGMHALEIKLTKVKTNWDICIGREICTTIH